MRPITRYFLFPLVLTLSALSLVQAETIITIETTQPGPLINKNIYGQFAEHLGRGIYEGMWVGPDSKIPNVRGWRTDVVDALKAMHVPLVRWPGGCFADEYHWRDGIGQRTKRPVRINNSWGGVTDDNAVGTHEFFDLAEQLGAETYVNGNLGTGSPQEMAEWLEYMTSNTNSTLAQERRQNGRDKPFKVDYFAIGNEAWGCGGQMTPEYFVDLYNRYATFAKTPKGHSPKFIAAGGNDANMNWTDVLSRGIYRGWGKHFDAISFHYYTLPTGDWGTKGAALDFPESQWMSTLANTLKMDELIAQNIAVLDKNDPNNSIGFYVDEWGTWYDTEKGDNPSFLYQQNSLRDAIVAALNFNIFHKYAARVQMTNIAQMVNVLQAMILTNKDKIVLTPTYYAFQMYAPFQDATGLPVAIKGANSYTLGAQTIAALSVSAARGKDGQLYLALVNTDPHRAQSLSVILDKGEIDTVEGKLLTGAAMDTHNSFAQPHAIQPVAYSAKANSNQRLHLELPAKSLLVLAVH